VVISALIITEAARGIMSYTAAESAPSFSSLSGRCVGVSIIIVKLGCILQNILLRTIGLVIIELVITEIVRLSY